MMSTVSDVTNKRTTKAQKATCQKFGDVITNN